MNFMVTSKPGPLSGFGGSGTSWAPAALKNIEAIKQAVAARFITGSFTRISENGRQKGQLCRHPTLAWLVQSVGVAGSYSGGLHTLHAVKPFALASLSEIGDLLAARYRHPFAIRKQASHRDLPAEGLRLQYYIGSQSNWSAGPSATRSPRAAPVLYPVGFGMGGSASNRDVSG